MTAQKPTPTSWANYRTTLSWRDWFLPFYCPPCFFLRFLVAVFTATFADGAGYAWYAAFAAGVAAFLATSLFNYLPYIPCGGGRND